MTDPRIAAVEAVLVKHLGLREATAQTKRGTLWFLAMLDAATPGVALAELEPKAGPAQQGLGFGQGGAQLGCASQQLSSLPMQQASNQIFSAANVPQSALYCCGIPEHRHPSLAEAKLCLATR